MKNIHVLTTNMMLNTTGGWLGNEPFCKALAQAGSLGAAIFEELSKAHQPLAQLESSRSSASTALRMLIDKATDLDALHDRKARAVHHHISGLIEGTDEPAKADQYRQLEGRLFPMGLRVVNQAYIEEGGAALALIQTVSPELRAQMAAIPVGDKTLDDLFGAWMSAGQELGEVVQERAKLKASLRSDGSAVGDIDIKAGRTQWIKAVRGLLWAIDMNAGLREVAELVYATLDEAIAGKLRVRDPGEPVGEGEALSEDVAFAEALGQEVEDGDDDVNDMIDEVNADSADSAGDGEDDDGESEAAE